MPLKIIRQDITKILCDAVVNPSNKQLFPGGGADLAIHKAAGPELLEYCKTLGGCEVGKAKITPGFNLPCKYVIHTAGPIWHQFKNAERLLASCYNESLKLAKEHNCETVAIPLISAGSYGFPKKSVLKIATSVISDFLFENEMLVYLVIFDKKAFEICEKLFCDVQSYIDDTYVDASSGRDAGTRTLKICRQRGTEAYDDGRNESFAESDYCAAMPIQAERYPMSEPKSSLEDMLRQMDRGFADTLFYFIDQKGITDVEAYKCSNVSKKTFSKIKCSADYKPSKITAISFAIGLKLNWDEATHLLKTAGYSLSNCNKFDVIIRYFIETGNYETIFDVNEVLYKFDQQLLGV